MTNFSTERIITIFLMEPKQIFKLFSENKTYGH